MISVVMEPMLPCFLQAVLQVALARPLDDLLRLVGQVHAMLSGMYPPNNTLRVHVPKHYILWAQSTHIGTTLGAKYIPFGYMDP